MIRHCFSGVLILLFAAGTLYADCIERAEKLLDAEKYSEALIALQGCSDLPGAWSMMGKSYYELYMMKEAVEYLGKAVNNDPSDREIRILFAWALGYEKEFRKAINEFNALLQEYPKDTDVLKGLAKSLGWNRRYDQAIEIYRDLLKKDPQDYESRLEIGILRGWGKKFREALSEFDAIIESKADAEWVFSARLHKAEILGWQKKFDDSIDEYKRARSVEPNSVETYLGIGKIHEWQGNYRDAKGEYESALIVDPESNEAKAALDQLMWVK